MGYEKMIGIKDLKVLFSCKTAWWVYEILRMNKIKLYKPSEKKIVAKESEVKKFYYTKFLFGDYIRPTRWRGKQYVKKSKRVKI